MVWPWFENVSVVWTLSSFFFRKKQLFSTTKICHFSASQMQWVGTLWVKLLRQFYFELFETLQTFCSWSEDVHVVWTSTYKYFYFPFFQRSHVSLSHIQSWFMALETLVPKEIKGQNLYITYTVSKSFKKIEIKLWEELSSQSTHSLCMRCRKMTKFTSNKRIEKIILWQCWNRMHIFRPGTKHLQSLQKIGIEYCRRSREYNSSYNILFRSVVNFANVLYLVWRCACGFNIVIILFFLFFYYSWT